MFLERGGLSLRSTFCWATSIRSVGGGVAIAGAFVILCYSLSFYVILLRKKEEIAIRHLLYSVLKQNLYFLIFRTYPPPEAIFATTLREPESVIVSWI